MPIVPKNGIQDGMHLGIDFVAIFVDFWYQDFVAIFVDFWYQVGVENLSKIDQKRHLKNDWKKKGSKMDNKTLQEAYEAAVPGGPGPRERSPPLRRDSPLVAAPNPRLASSGF